MNSSEILKKLQQIVGNDFVSNSQEELYIYSIDPGASEPRSIDFVVMPENEEQIQKIVNLANKEKIPIIPMGGGLTLSGLVIPVNGGIVLDMKRLNRILEIDETNRYAKIEAGVSAGQLFSHLEKNYPNLEVSIPDAPPSVTIAGNTLIHGSGFLSQKYGNHGDMLNGLELVLPNGEICRVGSCAVSDHWFTRGPIPDFIGLFTSSFGTMGIATKLSIKLYPKPKMRDLVFGIYKQPELSTQLIWKVTQTELAEDILLGVQGKPDWMAGYVFIITYITGKNQEELDKKEKKLKRIYRKNGARYMKAPPRIREVFLEKPQFAAKAADFRKGGGFEYVGSFFPLSQTNEAIKRGIKISEKYGIIPTLGARVIDRAHNVMVFFSYSFNRADPDDMQNARNALHDTNVMSLELGGIPWKGELGAQKLILEKMDPNYKYLLETIRNQLDPNRIMNPGNWEVK
ncbi:MAG: FAD-binding protein [Candidatus Lokiarchaeota archaeon]|nr:FAD-binding protein [Candidatus Lokiarchaeota archaeon]MBD3199898.1 FAD-binding protein [Candidatus Lokiarchaeota archaeon]